jgi:hypothetical protein
MSEHIPIIVPHPAEQLEAQILPLAEEPAGQAVTPSTPEQSRAVEAVFAQEEKAHHVVNFLGLWTGAMLLKDMALDALQEEEEEDEQDRRKAQDEEEFGDW